MVPQYCFQTANVDFYFHCMKLLSVGIFSSGGGRGRGKEREMD